MSKLSKKDMENLAEKALNMNSNEDVMNLVKEHIVEGK